MVDKVEFNLTGLEELRAKLIKLGKDTEFKGARFAGRKAANLIKEAAKLNAAKVDNPETPNNISSNIASRFSPSEFRRTGDTKFRIGVLGGAKEGQNNDGNQGGNTFYWRFIELGTSKEMAKPFMQPALADNIDNATNEFTKQFSRWLDIQARKQARELSKGN